VAAAYTLRHEEPIDLEERVVELLDLNRRAARGIAVADMLSDVARVWY